jgi:hypothetical protein
MKKLLYKNGDAMKKIFILGAIFLLFVSSSKVNADEICNIVYFYNTLVIVPTNETSRTQQATLEAFNTISPFFGTWDGACYDAGISGSLWFTFCQNGDARIYAMTPYDFSWDVVCGLDADNDDIVDSYDNCPDIANPNQEDADLDDIGDACDNDTIYGTISGAIQGGITIDIYVYSCGLATTVATVTTNNEGYYAVGGLGNDSYGIVPYYSDYVFSPKTRILQIPQTDIKSYDFTATELTCEDVDRFLDNGDGTVTDCWTDLVWLKDAFSRNTLSTAEFIAANLNSGDFGLRDGSVEGDWRLPTLQELQGIGTDPPATWGPFELCPPISAGSWSMPDAPFTNVQPGDYWAQSMEEGPYIYVLWLNMLDGCFNGTLDFDLGYTKHYVWPVRSAD